MVIASPRRAEAVPDVPTFAEVGLEEVSDPSWYGFVAPAGTPAEVIVLLGGGEAFYEGVRSSLCRPAAGAPGDFVDEFGRAEDNAIYRVVGVDGIVFLDVKERKPC